MIFPSFKSLRSLPLVAVLMIAAGCSSALAQSGSVAVCCRHRSFKSDLMGLDQVRDGSRDGQGNNRGGLVRFTQSTDSRDHCKYQSAKKCLMQRSLTSDVRTVVVRKAL
jgi:hypothetical protein